MHTWDVIDCWCQITLTSKANRNGVFSYRYCFWIHLSLMNWFSIDYRMCFINASIKRRKNRRRRTHMHIISTHAHTDIHRHTQMKTHARAIQRMFVACAYMFAHFLYKKLKKVKWIDYHYAWLSFHSTNICIIFLCWKNDNDIKGRTMFHSVLTKNGKMKKWVRLPKLIQFFSS